LHYELGDPLIFLSVCNSREKHKAVNKALKEKKGGSLCALIRMATQLKMIKSRFLRKEN
jgi:hypothetical protein